MGLSENRVPLNLLDYHLFSLVNGLFHWGYTLFPDSGHIWGFLKIETSHKMDDLFHGKSLLKWMISGYPPL